MIQSQFTSQEDSTADFIYDPNLVFLITDKRRSQNGMNNILNHIIQTKDKKNLLVRKTLSDAAETNNAKFELQYALLLSYLLTNSHISRVVQTCRLQLQMIIKLLEILHKAFEAAEVIHYSLPALLSLCFHFLYYICIFERFKFG